MVSKFDCSLRLLRVQALRGALGFAALVALAPLAAAQSQAAAPAAAVPASPAPAAQAVTPEPTPSHLAAARELVVVSGMSRSFDAAIPQMLHTLSSNYEQTRPDIVPYLVAVLKEVQPEFKKNIDQMTDKAAHIYARHLSEQEIKSAIAFFTSADGKKYVETEPLYFNEVINAMQDWHQQLADELMTRVRDEMKKKGHPL